VREVVEDSGVLTDDSWGLVPVEEVRVLQELVFWDPADLVGTAGSLDGYFDELLLVSERRD
jgi:hypothetical protein